jgi:deoxyadenosine/deoxycytidine kinase
MITYFIKNNLNRDIDIDIYNFIMMINTILLVNLLYIFSKQIYNYIYLYFKPVKKSIISIQGNIGVGKSTFVEILRKNFNATIVNEPVELWLKLKDDEGKNILEKFYSDMNRWSYSFQNVAYLSRMMLIEDAILTAKTPYIFLDRSLETDKYIFEKMLHDKNIITSIEHVLYNSWCHFYEKYVRNDFKEKIIYLHSDPTVCYSRIMKRGRSEEKDISQDYLDDIHSYHEEWLADRTDILKINCNQDFEFDLINQKKIIEMVKEFIQL